MAKKVFSYSNENVKVKLVISLKDEESEPRNADTVTRVVATRLTA